MEQVKSTFWWNRMCSSVKLSEQYHPKRHVCIQINDAFSISNDHTERLRKNTCINFWTDTKDPLLLKDYYIVSVFL